MGKTIMIVEDDQIFHDIYSEMLEDTDFPQSYIAKIYFE